MSLATTPANAFDVQPDAMRIAILCPPWLPVPPPRYGGIEAVVALLADGLVHRGHDVTLFAAKGSTTRAKLVAAHAPPDFADCGQMVPELRHALSCLRRADEFDVISDHTTPLACALSEAVATPVVHTIHGALDEEFAAAYDDMLEFAPRTSMISLSLAQRTPRPDFPWIANIPNAVDLRRYAVRERAAGTHLLWVGRMCADKGPDRAIDVARDAGLPLVLAGKMREAAERAYFERHVEPRLGSTVRYVGEADRDTLVRLLHDAIALVNPIAWPEPFGLVMIEAMACGVPVLATRCGAAPEIIESGVTGVLADDYRELAGMLPLVREIAPETCRAEAERRFAPRVMVDRYLAAFTAAIVGRGREAHDESVGSGLLPVLASEAF
jgi:glycosyltransferase involved in cell wall biosynthesis